MATATVTPAANAAAPQQPSSAPASQAVSPDTNPYDASLDQNLGSGQPANQPALGQPAGEKPSGEPSTAESAAAKPAPAPGTPEAEVMPWDKDPRFVEANDKRKQFLAEQATIDELRSLVATPDDAKFLLERVEKGDKAQQDIEQFRQVFADDPVAAAQEWRRVHPKAWQQVVNACYPGFYETLRKFAEQHRLSNLAEELDSAQRDFLSSFADGGAPARNGHPADKTVEAERNKLHSERLDNFQSQVISDVQSALTAEFDKLTANAAWPKPETKARILEIVRDRLADVIDGDRALLMRVDALYKAGQFTPQVRKQIADLHMNRVGVGGLMGRTIKAVMEELGIAQAVQQQQQKTQAELAQAQQRREPAAGGPASKAGAPTADELRKLQHSDDPYKATLDAFAP